MGEPKSVGEMIGEMLREAAVLITVFLPLDVVIAFYASLGWKEIMLLLQTSLIVGTVLAILGSDRAKTVAPGNEVMDKYLVALSPLILLLVAAVVGPIGLHYARLEREERARRDALNSRSTSPTT